MQGGKCVPPCVRVSAADGEIRVGVVEIRSFEILRSDLWVGGCRACFFVSVGRSVFGCHDWGCAVVVGGEWVLALRPDRLVGPLAGLWGGRTLFFFVLSCGGLGRSLSSGSLLGGLRAWGDVSTQTLLLRRKRKKRLVISGWSRANGGVCWGSDRGIGLFASHGGCCSPLSWGRDITGCLFACPQIRGHHHRGGSIPERKKH